MRFQGKHPVKRIIAQILPGRHGGGARTRAQCPVGHSEVSIITTRSQSQTLPTEITPRFLAELRAHGITKAFLFGSVARGEARPDSDLDLLVTFDPPITLFQRMDVANALSHLCGRRVDLITTIDPVFVPYIEPTLVPLPL